MARCIIAYIRERVVERSDACVCGGHTRVCVPDSNGVAADRSREYGTRLSSHRPAGLDEYAGHDEKYL
jgi:hypothetical protein